MERVLRMPRRAFDSIRARLNSSYYNRLLLYVLLPCLLTVAATLAVYFVYNYRYRQEITASYLLNLERAGNAIEAHLDEVLDNSEMLKLNKDYVELTKRPAFWEDGFYSSTRSVADSLQALKSTKALIHNAYLYSRSDDFVITPSGVCSSELFFSYSYRYAGYDGQSFARVRPEQNWFLALPPTTVNSSDSTGDASIMPIVILPRQTNPISWKIALIVNLDMDVLRETLSLYRLTPGSDLYILDERGRALLSTGQEGLPPDGLPDIRGLEERLLRPGSEVFSLRGPDGQRMLYIKRPAYQNTLRGVIFLAAIPAAELTPSAFNMHINVASISLLCVVLSFSFAYSVRRSMYKPVRGLLELVNEPGGQFAGKNEFETIRKHIGAIVNSNDQYREQISAMLPMVLEQRLMNLLLNHGKTEQNLAYLNERGIVFRCKRFQVSIVRIRVAAGDNRPESLSMLEAQCVGDLLDEIKMMTLAYGIFSNMDRVIVVANVDEDETLAGMEEYYRDIAGRIEQKYPHFELLIAMGRIRDGIAGLRNSYLQAYNNASLLTSFTKNRIVPFPHGHAHDSIHYQIQDENKLINALLSGKREESHQILNSVLLKNLEQSDQEKEQELMLALYLSVQRVVRERLLTVPEYKNGMSFYDMPLQEQRKHLYWLVEYVLDQICRSRQSNTDFVEILRFVESNFDKDIYLDLLSERYNMTPQYLSKNFKSQCGISFHNYLANLRVSKAKELLQGTGLCIDEVAEKVGYNSRYSFIRVFKSLEGLTPTEYRKLEAQA